MPFQGRALPETPSTIGTSEPPGEWAPGEPLPVVADISRLLRAWPAPADPAALVPWLADKAKLFDRIATATADSGLADDARAIAAAARHALATLAVPAGPEWPGGDAA